MPVPEGGLCRDNRHALLLLESEIPGGLGHGAHPCAVADPTAVRRKGCSVLRQRARLNGRPGRTGTGVRAGTSSPSRWPPGTDLR